MTDRPRDFDELGRLLAALCDGEITPPQAARLEELAAGSPEARRQFLEYVQLNAELHWAAGAGELPRSAAARALHPQSAVGAPRPRLAARVLRRMATWVSHSAAASLVLAALAAGALVAGVALWIAPQWRQGAGVALSESPSVARLTRTYEAHWSGEQPERADGVELPACAVLDLRRGLAEIVFQDGARVVLQGPARFEVESRSSGRVHVGRLHASVPHEAAGFTVHTPAGSVVDRGTEFGVAVDQAGGSEVHVFTGSVDILPISGSAPGGPPHGVLAGRAVRLRAPVAGAGLEIEDIPPDGGAFVRVLPSPGPLLGSVAALRALAAAHPDLLHHYTFEGATPAECRRDKRGDLHLIEAVMSGGRGGGAVQFAPSPLDRGDTVLRPFRAAYAGNSVGAGLQSEVAFEPPASMTIELLLNFAGFGAHHEGAVGAAVATRTSGRDCGFLVVAVDKGQLAFLFDGDESWGGSDDPLTPGEWYYVASTFQADAKAGATKVNTYLANLSRGETTLQWVVRDEVSPGVPAASRLGIGKGFDRDVAHAYPWAGMLDEVAVYQSVLDRETLGKHLAALTLDAR